MVRRCHVTRRRTRPLPSISGRVDMCSWPTRSTPWEASRGPVHLARGLGDRRRCAHSRALPGTGPDNAHKIGQIEVSGVVRAGQRVVQIENTSGGPHDMLIGRLKPGKTLDDVRRWDRDRTDPAPFIYVGGLTPMSSGGDGANRLVLQTGIHVVLCTMRHGGQREHDYQRGLLASFKVNSGGHRMRESTSRSSLESHALSRDLTCSVLGWAPHCLSRCPPPCDDRRTCACHGGAGQPPISSNAALARRGGFAPLPSRHRRDHVASRAALTRKPFSMSLHWQPRRRAVPDRAASRDG